MIKFLAITTICVVLTHARRISWQDEDFDASYRPLKILSHMNGLYDEERDYGEMTERGLGSLFTPRSMGRQTLKWNRIGSLPPARIGRLRSRRQRRRNRLGRNRKYRWEGEDETDMQIPDYPRPVKRNRRLMERYRLVNPRKFSTINGEEDDEDRERTWRYRKRYRPRFLRRNRKFRWEDEDETERPRRYRKRYRPRLLGWNRKYRWEDADENVTYPTVGKYEFSPHVVHYVNFPGRMDLGRVKNRRRFSFMDVEEDQNDDRSFWSQWMNPSNPRITFLPEGSTFRRRRTSIF